MQPMDHKDRSLPLALIGALLLIVGLVAAVMGPLEMYCFYLFTEGGRFHYDGFGFGSFMFGNIAAQIVGYYLIAAVLIPLGYGHLRRLRWARTFALSALGFWLVLGMPLMIVFLFVLLTAKELSPVVALVVVACLALSYPTLPALLIRFYRSAHVRLTFERQDPRSYWIEQIPQPVLVLCSLLFAYVVVLHVAILFRGVFPLFGILLFGLEGILFIDISTLSLLGLIWGLLKLKTWAWWGSLVFCVLMTSSVVVTLVLSDYQDILQQLRFPPTEMQALQGLPLRGVHLAAFLGVPLLITLGLILFSKRYFGRRRLTVSA